MKYIVALLLFTCALFGKSFPLQSIDGKVYHIELSEDTLKIKELPGKIIIIDFFGANCPPCIEELPDLTAFQKHFGRYIQMIGIQAGSRRDDAAMRKFVKKHGLIYPVFNLKEATSLIEYVMETVPWNGALPFKLFYGFDGQLAYTMYGMANESKLIKILKEL